MFKSLRQSLKNLLFFFKTIWYFRSYDYYFTTKILIKIFERILDEFERKPFYIGQIQEIYILREIVEKLKLSEDDDKYLDEVFNLLKKNYTRFWM